MLVTIKYFSKKTKLQQHERGRWLRAVTVIFWPPRRTYGQTRSNPNDVSKRHKVKRGLFFGRVHRERNKISLDCIYKNIPSSPPWIAEVSARIVSFTSSDVASLPKRITWFCRDSRSLSFSSSWDGASAVVGISFFLSHCCGAYYKENYRTKERKKNHPAGWI